MSWRNATCWWSIFAFLTMKEWSNLKCVSCDACRNGRGSRCFKSRGSIWMSGSVKWRFLAKLFLTTWISTMWPGGDPLPLPEGVAQVESFSIWTLIVFDALSYGFCPMSRWKAEPLGPRPVFAQIGNQTLCFVKIRQEIKVCGISDWFHWIPRASKPRMPFLKIRTTIVREVRQNAWLIVDFLDLYKSEGPSEHCNHILELKELSNDEPLSFVR